MAYFPGEPAPLAGLSLQYAVDGADERNQVVDRDIALVRGHAGMLAAPFVAAAAPTVCCSPTQVAVADGPMERLAELPTGLEIRGVALPITDSACFQ
jgi:hypothetical protein